MNRVKSYPELKEAIVAALKSVQDPELPLNIYEMGLIYEIKLDEAPEKVKITMTLTTPNCPVAEELPAQVEEAVKGVAGVQRVAIKLTFDPPYTMDRLSESAKITLGLL